jgi:hypothetical protein
MLILIKFSIMQNMIMNYECKQYREIVENRNGYVIAHGGMIAPFEYRFNSSFFPATIIKLLLLSSSSSSVGS